MASEKTLQDNYSVWTSGTDLNEPSENKIKQKNIWDDQRDLHSDEIYDETKELLLIFKYVVGWLMVPKDIHVLGFVTCQYVTYMTKRTLQIWLRIDLSYVGRT